MKEKKRREEKETVTFSFIANHIERKETRQA
jgi:hypothetical protein